MEKQTIRTMKDLKKYCKEMGNTQCYDCSSDKTLILDGELFCLNCLGSFVYA